MPFSRATLAEEQVFSFCYMDNISKVQRSYVMSRIGQRDTKIEVRFRLAVWRRGIRYRKNVRVYGTPDLLVRAARTVIFIDSCFWHGCRFHCRRPKSNEIFWHNKISKNRKRDVAVSRYYRRKGWTVLRIWEHQLRNDFPSCVAKAISMLKARKRRNVLSPR